MAEEEQETDAVEEGEKKGGLKKIILIAVGVILLIGVSVGATIFFMPTPEPAMDAEMTPEEMMAEDPDAMVDQNLTIYLAMKPAIIVNYQVQARQRFLQVELSLVAKDQESVDAATAHMPLIRNNMIEVMGTHNFDSLRTFEGKQQLVEDLTVVVQDILLEEIGRPGIENVLFRSFVMQ